MQQMPRYGPALSWLDSWCSTEADGVTNLEQPSPNHVRDMAASGVSAVPTHALKRTSPGSGLAMEEPEHDAGSVEQLDLYYRRALSYWNITPGWPFSKCPTWGRRMGSGGTYKRKSSFQLWIITKQLTTKLQGCSFKMWIIGSLLCNYKQKALNKLPIVDYYQIVYKKVSGVWFLNSYN